MNSDVFRYKQNFLICILIFSYAYMHLRLTGVYDKVPLIDLIQLKARLPYGQRLLVPLMGNFIQQILPLSAKNIFFILEVFFTTLSFFAIKKLLLASFNKNESLLLSLLFLLLLPLVTIVNYRYSWRGESAIYYVYDTATIFFTAKGIDLILRQQFSRFYILLAFATLNRESSLLLVGLIPFLNWKEFKRIVFLNFKISKEYIINLFKNDLFTIFLVSLFIYLTIHLSILYWAQKLPGEIIEWKYKGNQYTHVFVNLFWLFESNNIYYFFYSMLFLPIAWFVFYDFIPLSFRPIKWLLMLYFIGLSIVGNFMEARIFEEIIICMYLPVCLGIKNWLTHKSPILANTPIIMNMIDRYGIFSIIIVLSICFKYC